MLRSGTFWLTLTNIVLGTLVALCVVIIALVSLCQVLSTWRKRRSSDAELDHDMREMFAPPHTPVALHHTGHGRPISCPLEALCRLWRRLSCRHE